MSTEKNTEFKDRFDTFMKNAKKATKKAANKTMELADIASLNLKLQGLNVKLSEKFETLGKLSYKKLCNMIVDEFDNLPIDENLKKPRVGVVGEILVKYMLEKLFLTKKKKQLKY